MGLGYEQAADASQGAGGHGPEMAHSTRIGIVCPGGRIEPDLAERVAAFACAAFPERPPELIFHPQCFLSAGHFAGDDAARAQAFLEIANDPAIDALWVGRGGYGACRMAEAVLAGVTDAARAKTYLGYSDAGALLGALYKNGFLRVAHGPMPVDITREGGEAAVRRALSFLTDGDAAALEPTAARGVKTAAYNMMILSTILCTPLEPDLSDHVLMLEEVGEYMYRIDRILYQITASPMIRRARGIKLGRWSAVPKNDPDFGMSEEDVMAYWCARAGIAYLGRADIGHDVDNKIVPFGSWPAAMA